jgi:hypothetical protein
VVMAGFSHAATGIDRPGAEGERFVLFTSIVEFGLAEGSAAVSRAVATRPGVARVNTS